ncbi:hypothetical protein ACET3Z_028224 [Daucus carota]
MNGNLGFLRALMREGRVVLESKHEETGEGDSSDENGKEVFDSAKQHQSEEQARRKKMSRIEEGFLNNMVKMMEVCNAQGFVYGIIPENGKPVIGAFDSLCEWWKDKVSFILILSHLKPVIAYHESFLICETSDYDLDEVEDIEKIDVEECQAHDANLFNLRNDVLKNRPIVPPPALVKGELVDGVIEFLPEKKQPSNARVMAMDKVT